MTWLQDSVYPSLAGGLNREWSDFDEGSRMSFCHLRSVIILRIQLIAWFIPRSSSSKCRQSSFACPLPEVLTAYMTTIREPVQPNPKDPKG